MNEMRVGIYARVSTTDKDQNPETQLLPLREFCHAQRWDVVGEFVDQASATDLRSRTQWKRLLDLAAKRRIDVILVWEMDRAFRSVAHASQTLEQLRRWGVGLRSYSEPWLDTSGTSPAGELMFNILASFAQFERSLIAERVRAGMARAKASGTYCGRPQKLNGELEALRPAIESGQLSRHRAARQLGVTPTTISRALARTAPGAKGPRNRALETQAQ
jgi:DNA invertase Pin-like site-specific DNA recombinase